MNNPAQSFAVIPPSLRQHKNSDREAIAVTVKVITTGFPSCEEAAQIANGVSIELDCLYAGLKALGTHVYRFVLIFAPGRLPTMATIEEQVGLALADAKALAA